MGRIERFTTRTEAEIGRSVLEVAGIPAYVSGDDAGGLHPEIPFGIGGTAVVVSDEQHQEALAVLDEELELGGIDEANLTTAALSAVDDSAGAPPAYRIDTGGDHVPPRGHGRALVVAAAVALTLAVGLAVYLLAG